MIAFQPFFASFKILNLSRQITKSRKPTRRPLTQEAGAQHRAENTVP